MKIRGSVASWSFIFPHPREDNIYIYITPSVSKEDAAYIMELLQIQPTAVACVDPFVSNLFAPAPEVSDHNHGTKHNPPLILYHLTSSTLGSPR